MIHGLDDVRQRFDVDADAVVVGSGAGGAVAAANLAAGGLRTVVLEAGPHLRPEDMIRDAPTFLARYYWEGGLRTIGGTAQVPCMQGRCVGGSTVVNSAIMFALPERVRRQWIDGDGLADLADPALDRAFDRVFERCRVAPTPLTVLGRRNTAVRDALEAAGIPSKPLPRAVQGCQGCGDCLTGCATGAKQSVDRSWLPGALRDGAQVYACAEVDRILTAGGRAAGVEGRVVDPHGFRTLARFRVRAPRVVLAAGALNTPALLLRSGLRGGPGVGVGDTLYTHIGGSAVGLLDEVVDPWVGATQGWGALSEDIPGMKFESLWAPTGLIVARWGDVGRRFLEQLALVRHATLLVSVYAGRVTGRVRVRRNGLPAARIHVPDDEVRIVMRGMVPAIKGLFAAGARAVTPSVHGVPMLERPEDADVLLQRRVRARDIPMTFNHIFGSCRMSADARRGPVAPDGRLRGVEGVWLADASVFPGPSAVNPQATVMALADLITRRMADLPA